MSWTVNFNAAALTFLAQHPLTKHQGGHWGSSANSANIKGGQRPSLISLTPITWPLQGERPELGKGRDDTWKAGERDQITEEKQISCLPWDLKKLFLPPRVIYTSIFIIKIIMYWHFSSKMNFHIWSGIQIPTCLQQLQHKIWVQFDSLRVCVLRSAAVVQV